MREIQTEIRHDRIENDNRKDELQSKAQSGLKTAVKPQNSEAVQNQNNQPQITGGVTDKPYDLERLKADTMLDSRVQQANAAVKAAQSIEAAASNNGGNSQKEAAEKETSSLESYSLESFDNRTSHTAAVFTASKLEQKEQIVHQVPRADTGIQKQIKHEGIENTVQRNVIQNKAASGIKTAKADKISKVKEKASSGFISARKASMEGALKTAAAIGSAAVNVISGAAPSGDNEDLGSESADKVKKTAGTAAEKSFDAIKSFAQNKARTVKASGKGKTSRSRIYKLRVNLSEHITEHIKPLKLVRDKARAIKTGTAKAVNSLKVVKAVKKLNAIKIEDVIKSSRPVRAVQSLKVVKAVKKLNSIKVEDIMKASKAYKAFASLKAVKAVKKLNSVKIGKSSKAALNSAKGAAASGAIKGVSSAVNTVQRVQSFSNSGDIGSDLAEQTKEAAGKAAEKAAQLSKKTVKKISKSVKTMKNASKPAKRTLRTASKKAVKTSAKTAGKAAEAAAKTAAKTAEASVKISTKIITGIANALGSLMTSPAGPIVLIIVLILVLIIIIFNLISGSVQVPVTVVSGAGSSLGWLFEDDSRANDDIADIYADFEGEAYMAMSDVRLNYKDTIIGLGLGERDSIVLNGASYYPANAAADFVQNVLDSLDYSDYMYLCEICYIKKLRDERAALGLSENDMPEVTITRMDILSFLLDFGFIFDLTVEGGQECPTADCKEKTFDTMYCSGMCNPNPDGSPGTCPGHTPPPQKYCDHSHLKAVITVQEVPRDTLEDVVLALTEEEKNMIEIALELLNDSIQP